ncbi:TonB family protein [Afipia carboxidovorans]|uniref:TonB family protein n=1 Tax=Afipia carboxidovorans TaxID=40137 RepID=UPI00308A619F|nr:energy transducer TonB [Afipia carboxidovorans]
MFLTRLWNDSSHRVWVLAAIAALVLHGAVAAVAVASFSGTEDDEELGAAGIEVGLEFLAPRGEITDLPPGPDTEASAASPEVVEQKAEVKESDLPQEKPVESEDPDRVVSPDKATDPKESDPNKAARQQTASTESVAAEATAMPTSEAAQQSDRSMTLAQGTGASKQRIRATWQKELVAHLDRHKRYPADRSDVSVKIMVSFEIDRTGRLIATTIAQGSGDPEFDQAALAMLKRSDPVPAPPPLVADEGLTFTLPVVFRARGQKK